MTVWLFLKDDWGFVDPDKVEGCKMNSCCQALLLVDADIHIFNSFRAFGNAIVLYHVRSA